ncbi:MAG TPA: NAD(P)/FAD-dependent oxidoreductase [Candidatus Pacearchaeota archaeon]|nr:NAD(P)/FAD-dependent oxidoreductase [Candidatus Pacearchaeota archaeon]
MLFKMEMLLKLKVENNMEKVSKKYDIAVIGGGPAGMMAAIRAGEIGARVVLIEKNEKIGVKLLMTGGGRCNLTHVEKSIREFCGKFGKQGDFLLSPFSIFGTKETMEFFENNGIELKKEMGKVFPASDKAKDILNVLVSLLKKYKVDILFSSEVKEINKKGKLITSVSLLNGKEIEADQFIISSGGRSYPSTGSSGDSFIWAKRLGHDIVDTKPALTPIETKEQWTKSLQGISLEDVSISLFCNQKKESEGRGEILFTHFGFSGPLILDMSRTIGDLLERGKVKMTIDLFPSKNTEQLDKFILSVFNKNRKKHVLKCLNDFFPEKLSAFILNFSSVSFDRKGNDITKDERVRMIKFLKKIEISIVGLLGFDKAMATHGGISLKTIDSKTMKSKLINNLYFAGEAINLDGPCGGYNLQMCWTTGYVAGQNAASSVK